MLQYKSKIISPVNLDIFLKFLKIKPAYIRKILNNKDKFYYSFPIEKANGDTRLITPSTGELKAIQKNTKLFIDKCFKWPFYIHGGIKRRSTLSNAKCHIGKYMVTNLDIKTCFPNTSQETIEESLISVGFEKDVAFLLSDICSRNNELPQGAPTSTCIINIVLGQIDKRFYRFCKSKNFKYTRFVDDITVSADLDLRPFKNIFFEFIGSLDYSISKYSTIDRSKRQVVTGLMVNERIRPTSLFIRELKYDIKSGWPEYNRLDIIADNYGLTIPELKNNIWGRVNFIKSIDRKLGRNIRGLVTKMSWSI